MYLSIVKNNKHVRNYLLATASSNLGNVMTGMALLFLAYDLTASNAHTTGIAIAQVVPYLLFGLFGGVIADWITKIKWLIRIDLFRSPLLMGLVLLDFTNQLAYYHLIIVSVLIHLCGCLYNPAHRAIIPLITKETERAAINSLVDTVTRGMTVLGPVFSIIFMNTIGVIHFFTLDAISYVLSALFLSFIPLKEEQRGKKQFNIFSAVREFAVWLRSHQTIRSLFELTAFIVFFNTWVWQVGLLLMLQETTKNAEAWYSLITGCFGIIVIIVNLIIPYIFKQFSLRTYLISSFIWGIGILFLGWLSEIPLIFLGIIWIAVGVPLSGLSRIYLLQKYIPPDKLGRGFSFNAFLLYFSNLISLSFFGILSYLMPVSTIFILCGACMVIVSGIYVFLELRK
ncbi:MFS transporter [Oceanobacillus jeddahense]|uniref:MFS transporter n=1 Tax=Oceanobacillus jeddahense TaxID=1462527 RepID=A0ABY5JRD1_9BACI|nr:MFS transporter [Oceanobacillus jeddahense]UUI02789.1 MFS transporter [Oceanobacillus jeddahense]